MTEKNNETSSSKIKETIDSVTALTKAVPIYDDAVQPLAKETGKALGTIGKAVNVALSPLSLVVWGYDQIKDFLESRVSEKLENVDESRISTPPPNIAGPAIEALKFVGHDETLKDMFANLIANSIDSKTVIEAHPSFVEIIKSLSPDEGLILKSFAATTQFPLIDVKLVRIDDRGFVIIFRNVSTISSQSGCQHPQLISNYLDNLCRLGLLEIPSGQRLNEPSMYDAIKNDPSILQIQKQFEDNKMQRIELKQKYIQTTGMGKQFINACVIDKRQR